MKNCDMFLIFKEFCVTFYIAKTKALICFAVFVFKYIQKAGFLTTRLK